MLLTCFASLFMGAEKISKGLILDLGLNSVDSWWGSLAFIFVFVDSLLYVHSHSVKHAVKACGIIISILHRVVSKDIEIHVSASHARVLCVGDRNINIQTEGLEGKRLFKNGQILSTYILGVNHSCHVRFLRSQYNFVVQENTCATRFPIVERTYQK